MVILFHQNENQIKANLFLNREFWICLQWRRILVGMLIISIAVGRVYAMLRKLCAVSDYTLASQTQVAFCHWLFLIYCMVMLSFLTVMLIQRQNLSVASKHLLDSFTIWKHSTVLKCTKKRFLVARCEPTINLGCLSF